MKKLLVAVGMIAVGVLFTAGNCLGPPKAPDAPIPSRNATDKVEIAWTIDNGETQHAELGRYDYPIAQWDVTIDRFSKSHKKASVTGDRNYIGHVECEIWYFHNKLAYVADFATNEVNTPVKCEISVQEIDVMIEQNFGDPEPWDVLCPCNPAEDQLKLVVKWTLVG